MRLLRAENRKHNSLRSDKCSLLSNAVTRGPRGTSSPDHAPLPGSSPLLVGGKDERPGNVVNVFPGLSAFWFCVLVLRFGFYSLLARSLMFWWKLMIW